MAPRSWLQWRKATSRGLMGAGNKTIQVMQEANASAAFLGDVVIAADSDRDALGFFSRSVYSDFCQKGQLFVATLNDGKKDIYVGHLLFDLRFPKAHVRQIYVLKEYRNLRVGATLLSTLKDHLTRHQFMSICARVAEDLKLANAFWEAQGFYAQRVAPGGATRKRMIVARVHELDTPQLFASSGINVADPLGLDMLREPDKPLYLLDLNVLFDLGPRRERHSLAMDVFRAQRMQACSLAVSGEIEVELKRTARDSKTDPMLSFVATLARFSVPPESALSQLQPELGSLVFAPRCREDSLTANDYSDLKHLATAIHHRLPGLITSDDRILDAAQNLRTRYGIDVISPSLFQVPTEHLDSAASHEGASSDLIEVGRAVYDDTCDVQTLLTTLGVDLTSQIAEWATTDTESGACVRLVARCNGLVVGYLVWPASLRGHEMRVHAAIAEDRQGAVQAAQALLRHLTDVVRPGDINFIRLTCPQHQAILREVAGSFGYTASATVPSELQKIVVKQRLTSMNWAVCKAALASVSRLGLPDEPFTFRHVDQQVAVTRTDGQRVLVPLFKLETLLAPALICLSGREGVLVPIRKQFEKHLLSESPQASFLPQSKAQLSPAQHYLSDKKTLRNFARGDLLFFYESTRERGAGAVVAVGRVLRAYHRDDASMQDEDLAASVLSSDQLSTIGTSKTKTITVFDNVMRLPRPVPLQELKRLKCGDAHQLITSQRLTGLQVQAILEKGL